MRSCALSDTDAKERLERFGWDLDRAVAAYRAETRDVIISELTELFGISQPKAAQLLDQSGGRAEAIELGLQEKVRETVAEVNASRQPATDTHARVLELQEEIEV